MLIKEEEEEEVPLHGDLLETVLSHMSLLDLLSAAQVSKVWRNAVATSLRHPARGKPWLILHLQSHWNPAKTTAHAYDPYSQVWIKIPHAPTPQACALRASGSNHLFSLSPSNMGLPCGALNVEWINVGAPQVWRQDPIVATIRSYVVIAGGTCEFEDDPLAVEVLDAESGSWVKCEPMPATFKDSASATWLSVAASDQRMYVLVKNSGDFCSFDVNTMKWGSATRLLPDPSLFFSVIAFARDRLILFGLAGDSADPSSLRFWEVNCNTLEHKEIGRMPKEMLGRLKNANSPLSSIGVCSSGDFVYIHNPSDPSEIFHCDFSSGICEWGSVRNSVANDRNRLDRFLFTCSNVGLDDLQAVF